MRRWRRGRVVHQWDRMVGAAGCVHPILHREAVKDGAPGKRKGKKQVLPLCGGMTGSSSCCILLARLGIQHAEEFFKCRDVYLVIPGFRLLR